MVEVASLLFVPALLFLGIVTSYEDFRHGKIRNKWVVFALGYSFLVMALMVSWMATHSLALPSASLVQYALNLCFSLIFGMIAWRARLWSAGDAKLFVAFASLVPLPFYVHGYFFSFPSFAILINTLVPVFGYCAVTLLFKTSRERKIEALKELAKPKYLLEGGISAFAFSWIGYFGLTWAVSHAPLVNTLIAMLTAIFLLRLLFRNLGISPITISWWILVAALLFDHQRIFTSHFLLSFLLSSFLSLIASRFFLLLGFEGFSRPVFIEDLKPGMLPAENFLQLGERGIDFKKKPILPFGLFSDFVEKSEGNLLFKTAWNGMEEAEIKKVQLFHSEDFLKDHTVRVYVCIPFAPFLFLGVILTIIFQGNVFFAFFG